MHFFLEIAANSVESAIEAQKGGADRVELCGNLSDGGTTPSYGSILLARKNLHINLHVLIRPRRGDFLYSENEFEVMKNDIIICKQLGIDGIVSGILNKDGTVDVKRTSVLVNLSRPLSFTFHRAIDTAVNIFDALDALVLMGCNRVLTSGGYKSAFQGISTIKQMVKRYGNKITIIAGSGITPDNIAEIALKTKANEFHLSGKSIRESGMIFKTQNVSFVSAEPVNDYQIIETDSDIVRSTKDRLKNDFRHLKS